MRYPKVKHPEWIQHVNIEKTVRLSKAIENTRFHSKASC